MKKFFAFVAIACMAFGLASCSDESDKKKFQITVEDIHAKWAYYSVIPLKPDMKFKTNLIQKNLFSPKKPNTHFMWSDTYTEAIEDEKMGYLYPSTNWVLAVAEVDDEGDAIGNAEFVEFKTDDLPYDLAEPLHFTGEYQYNPDNVSYAGGKSTLEEDGVEFNFRIYTIGHKQTGQVTTDNIVNFFFWWSSLDVIDTQKKDTTTMVIYNVDYTIDYNKKTKEYKRRCYLFTFGYLSFFPGIFKLLGSRFLCLLTARTIFCKVL